MTWLNVLTFTIETKGGYLKLLSSRNRAVAVTDQVSFWKNLSDCTEEGLD